MTNRSMTKSPEKTVMITPEDKARVDMLHIHVNGLVPSGNEDMMIQQLQVLQQSFLAACTDETVLHFAVENLMDKCMENRALCDKLAILFQDLSDIVIGNKKVRHVILTCLQNNFSHLKDLQEKSNARWLNSIALFVAIFHRLRYSNGEQLLILAPYVIQALQPLFSGDEAEMKLLAESVICNGFSLRKGDTDGFDQLLLDVRSTLIQRNLSSECRLWLLITADVGEVNFEPLRSPLLEFYKKHLGDEIQSVLEKAQKNKPVAPNPTPVENVVAQAPVSPASPASPKSPTLESNASVRSTRFSERNERRPQKTSLSPRSKDGLVEKVQNFRINEKSQNFGQAIGSFGSSSKGKSHWGHDDRFENDYENPSRTAERPRGKKNDSFDKSEWSERSDRPERTRIPEGNWRQAPSKESKDQGVRDKTIRSTSPPNIAVYSEEVWD